MPSPFDYTVSPNPNNDPADDAPVMRTNSQSIQDIILTDHVGYNNTKGGMHNQVTFAINQSAPGFATGKSDLFANTASGQSWPFWQNASGIFQMLGNAFSAAASGYLTFPNGIILKWGTKTGMTQGNNTVSFSPVFPTAAFIVIVQPIRTTTTDADNLYVRTGTLSASGFTIVNTSSSIPTAYWFAIGN